LTRLPRRSAIVAFSAEEVYAIAELIRRQRGGAAVVLGALSPRTRNAQVALYQAGEVEYLVATDAIGMGLNLDVDHVAFASDRKFDGYQFRKLNPAELAQIAGRAGRATRDGSFGTTGRCPPFETELARALESHTFEPVKIVQWRNTDLDFSSIGALQATLATAPSEGTLTRAAVAEDILVLDHAARDEEVRALTRTAADVQRLWDVCQIPDYRKIAPATHAELVVSLYGYLQREGTIPTDWFASQVALADRTDGDIDTLSNRIAHIRTWTFAANRPDWLADPEYWQGVTRGVEDKLSDALHERLTERFIDRRTSVLMRRLRENAQLESVMSKTGEVVVEGHTLGRLDGFVFVADASSSGSEAKALHNAAQKALVGEIGARAARLAEAPDQQFVLAADGTVRWTGAAVAKLVAGEDVLRPHLRLIADEQLSGAPRESVETRLDRWLKTHIDKLLGPLFQLAAATDVSGLARGVAFQLVEALGVLERQRVADAVKGLEQPERASLRKYGVRFGAYHIYVPLLLKPAPRALAAQLWALAHSGLQSNGLDDLLHFAAGGRTSIPVNSEIDPTLYRAAGYRVCGERAVRVDILERLADLIRPALAWREGAPGQKPLGAVAGGGFTVVNAMTSLIGASGESFASVLRSLGYRMEKRPRPAESSESTVPHSEKIETQQSHDTTSSAETTSAATEPDAVSADAILPESVSTYAAPAAIVSAGDETAIVGDKDTARSSAATLANAEEAGHDGNADLSSDGKTQRVESDTQSETAPPLTAATQATAETLAGTALATEPDLIEVWRPGRSAPAEGPRRSRTRHQRRPHHRRRDGLLPGQPGAGPGPAQPDGTTPIPAEVKASASEPAVETAAAGPQDQRHRHKRRDDQRSQPPRRERDRAAPHGSRSDSREKAPDPNSPFAKLAALKAQLEANAKEQR
jgi:ATP-dependent RNA helicase SUPV3L1/SUV3